MNCIDFRRNLAVAPKQWSRDMKHHAGECAACGAAATAMIGLEQEIHRALQTDPPGGLGETIKRAAFAEPPAETARRGGSSALIFPTWPKRWGIAAGLVIFISAVIGSFGLRTTPTTPGVTLDDAIVTIIRDEVLPLASTAKVGPEELRSTLTTIGLSLAQPLEGVRFATTCVIRGRIAAHWVLEGQRAPVTVFVMPDEPLNAKIAIRTGSMRGLLLPSERGSIAVVGMKGERLDEISRRIHAAVKWNA